MYSLKLFIELHKSSNHNEHTSNACLHLNEKTILVQVVQTEQYTKKIT